MKQWKLLLTALLCVLLVCFSVSALAAVGDPADNGGINNQGQSVPVTGGDGQESDPTEHELSREPVRTADGKQHYFKITYWVLENGEHVVKTKNTDPENHSWQDVIGAAENKDATCTAKGAQKQICYACGVTQVIDVAQKKHDTEKVAAKAAEICVVAGNEEYYKCKTCTGIFEDKAGKKPLTEIPVVKPQYETHQLNYVDNAEVVPATCTEDGHVYPVCNHCNKMFKKEAEGAKILKATGHDFPAWDSNEVQIVLPTCYLDGYKVRHCRNTNCQEQEVLVIKSKGHDFATAKDGANLYFPDPENPATCTKPGNVIRVCKNGCGMNISEAVDALGHKWGAWTYTYPTTDDANNKWACEQPTTRTRKCTVNGCDGKETETVFAPVGHNWYVFKMNEKTGETTMKCLNCGKEEVWPKGADEIVTPVDEQTTPADKTTPAPTPVVKSEEAKSEEKSEEPKSEEPKSEEPKSEEPKSEEPKSEEPKSEEPSEEPAPAPAASRTQARIFEEDTFTVQTLKKGGTYKLPIIDSFGNVVGTLVITVDEDQLVASYKVTDTKGKDLKLDAEDFCVRVYNNLDDAQALNENFVHWGCGEKVYGVNLDADYALVYMIVDYMIL